METKKSENFELQNSNGIYLRNLKQSVFDTLEKEFKLDNLRTNDSVKDSKFKRITLSTNNSPLKHPESQFRDDKK
ncbi:MAG: hypothetical protein MHPSP_001444, partial [Paramarteilia canceri]